MTNRKGTEKPIEIFVALFIILAVALVMLKLFQGQIADKTTELANQQQEQKGKDQLSKVEQACKEICVQASNNNCNDANLARLCAFSSENVLGQDSYIDLNNDQKKDMDKTLRPGVGICEDKVYCFHLIPSCCGREISASSCRQILIDFDLKTKVAANAAAAKTLAQSQLSPTSAAGNSFCVAGAPRWDSYVDWAS